MNTMAKYRRPKAPKSGGKDWPDRLAKLRKRLGLSQTEAAARVSISQSQWSAYESGRRKPTRPIARLIELLESGKI